MIPRLRTASRSVIPFSNEFSSLNVVPVLTQVSNQSNISTFNIKSPFNALDLNQCATSSYDEYPS